MFPITIMMSDAIFRFFKCYSVTTKLFEAMLSLTAYTFQKDFNLFETKDLEVFYNFLLYLTSF